MEGMIAKANEIMTGIIKIKSSVEAIFFVGNFPSFHESFAASTELFAFMGGLV